MRSKPRRFFERAFVRVLKQWKATQDYEPSLYSTLRCYFLNLTENGVAVSTTGRHTACSNNSSKQDANVVFAALTDHQTSFRICSLGNTFVNTIK